MPVYVNPWPPEFFAASPMIISETETHIVIAVEIAKASLARHQRFLDSLQAAARRAADD